MRFLEDLRESPRFTISRRPSQRQAEAKLGLRDGVAGGGGHSSSEGLGRLDVNRVVQRHQRLQRSVGADATNVAVCSLGGVECGHRWVRGVAANSDVKPTAILVLT